MIFRRAKSSKLGLNRNDQGATQFGLSDTFLPSLGTILGSGRDVSKGGQQQIICKVCGESP